ncbi:(Fe-S)-binding protein [Wenzhouxiangella sp. XN24]|uniref:(Fe-S)-binding protein n=1 Tax=Wenzhouxiangella sp. XN24 TaxID=2713569 RepID=UPI0013EA4128|nr:(Fe-S)-binding protein [Wenzhouxiangella sp. XN24]NGX15896.1 (Fe-S)-binding protein [Wenzhouxiangella sp. XN24]
MTKPAAFPLDLADRCVKCGLCLPHCPTYQLSGVEGESPRGRIALMQGLATGRLEPTPGLVDHLNQCLGCRACERVCPADVPYGELIDAGHALLVSSGHPRAAHERALASLMRRPAWLRKAVGLARLPGVGAAAKGLGGLPARAMSLLPGDAGPARLRDVPAPKPAPLGEALLFAGCVSGAVDGRSLDDTRHLLETAGWQVCRPPRQGCCGAIDLHAGYPEIATGLAERNLAAFPGDGPVVACASGCAATLLDYARLAGEPGARFARRIRDPAELLADAPLEFGRGQYRSVVLHVPCTQRNVTRSSDATRRLLARIPDLAVRELPAGCCGAAGAHFLSHPRQADALLEAALARLARDPPEALVTSNIGCAMHFAAGLKRIGLDIPVMHPASLARDALK